MHGHRWLLAIPVVALAVLFGLYVIYARQYFFLFDDFALVGQASTSSVPTIFGRALFGFYRPVVFLAVKAVWAVWSWQHPGAYMAAIACVHWANASLVFVLLRRLGSGPFAALSGAALFAASPWASEACFWLSGSFDVLSLFGMLVSVIAVLALTTGGGAIGGVVAVTGACLAMLAKENAIVVLPVLLPGAVLARGGARRVLSMPLLWATLTGLAVAYLVARQRLLPGFGGAYGSLGSLLAHGAIAANAIGYVRAFVTLPVPWVAPGTQLGGGTAATVLATALIVLVAWRAHRGVALVGIAGFTAAIAPTLWTQPAAFASFSGRFMYAPGAFGCLVAGAAIDILARRERWTARIGAAALAAVVLGLAIADDIYQARLWSRASVLSRAAIEQVRPLAAGGTAKIFIPNLPFWLTSGPFVIRDYAFAYYYPGSTLSVRSRNFSVDAAGAREQFAGWLDAAGAPDALPPRPQPGERVVTLHPVALGTPLAEPKPAQLSVFATLDGRRISDATVALSALTSWRAETDDPALLRVEPARGETDAVLRLVPLARPDPVDRIVEVRICADDAGAAVLATLAVRVRMMPSSAAAPPRGAVDLPAAPEIAANDPAARSLQGWAVDGFDLRRVYGEAVGADGRRVALGDAVRAGERPDVSRILPAANDLYRAAWSLAVDPAGIASLAHPVTIDIYAENGDGLRSRIGSRIVGPAR